MDDYSTNSESDYANSWITWFLSTKGNEYFVEIDDDYLMDRFNLTGLNGELVKDYSKALDMILDNLEGEESMDDEERESLDTSARFLYGLIHARFIVTSRGLAKMLEKYRRADFGRCPRVYCYAQSLLPVGLSDTPYTKAVKLYCPRCEDVYSPKSNRHGSIDGAYFGTTFPHMLFMVYPQMIPGKAPPPQITGQVGGASSGNMQGQASPVPLTSAPTTANDGRDMQLPTPTTATSSNSQPVPTSAAQAAASAPAAQIIGGTLSTATTAMKAEIYDPKLFGFRVNEMAKLKRWREVQRDLQVKRLEALEREETVV
ncbi:hypothetical protein QFC21_005680 [Naganishia friedmannii]|uniref:Uncharacterized protein n=1 Tax=Naganishia friedmannii TaxID=89922 RepID=A0ACC2V818_9TREE|nr:hypothetical protein QFC21_005680 [Naganishia friedmannii]